jgi:hypothetical protein
MSPTSHCAPLTICACISPGMDFSRVSKLAITDERWMSNSLHAHDTEYGMDPAGVSDGCSQIKARNSIDHATKVRDCGTQQCLLPRAFWVGAATSANPSSRATDFCAEQFLREPIREHAVAIAVAGPRSLRGRGPLIHPRPNYIEGLPLWGQCEARSASGF